MSTSKEYAAYVLETLAPIGDVRIRPMMGEYVLYYKDKVVGGIYDERVLVKNIPAAAFVLVDAPQEIPYDGAKPMLLVEELEDTVRVQTLMNALFDALPGSKSGSRKARANDKRRGSR